MSTELGLRPDTVEKDYVLGWMLWGIQNHADLSSWVFKGGTSLKKSHFETYRFSEDLDFTLTERAHLDPEFLSQSFREGNRLFYGFERDANHVKAYDLRKIESVNITERPYSQRYPVEISNSGPISMRPATRRT